MKILVPLFFLALINSRKIYAFSDRQLKMLKEESNPGPKDRYLLDETSGLSDSSGRNNNNIKPIDLSFWDPIRAFKDHKERMLSKISNAHDSNIDVEYSLKPMGSRKQRNLSSKTLKITKTNKKIMNPSKKLQKNHKSTTKSQSKIKKTDKGHRKLTKYKKALKKRSLKYKEKLSKAIELVKEQKTQQSTPSIPEQQNLPQTLMNNQDQQQTANISNPSNDLQNRNLNIQLSQDSVVDPTSQNFGAFEGGEQMNIIQNMIKNAKTKKKIVLTPSELTMLQSISHETGSVSTEQRDAAISAGARACQSSSQQNIFYQILGQINSQLINVKMASAIASIAALRMAKAPQKKFNLELKRIKSDLMAARQEFDFKMTKRDERADSITKLLDLLEQSLNDMGNGMSSKVRMLNAMVLKKFKSNDLDVMLLDAH